MTRFRTDYVDCSPGDADAREPAGNGQATSDPIEYVQETPDPGILPSDPPGTRRGWTGLRCPRCGEVGGGIDDRGPYISLERVDIITCAACGDDFFAQEAIAHFRAQADLWRGVLEMTRRPPILEDGR